MNVWVILIVSALISGLGVRWIRRMAIARQMIDIPNGRSSHKQPTPRGGGLSIALVVTLGALLLGLLGTLEWSLVAAVLAGALVAVIGYIDDRSDLSPVKRALVHVLAACLGLFFLGGMPPLDLGFTTIEWGWLGHAVGVLGIVWMINLYNFMDGIDGLASSEAIFVFGVGGLMLASSGLAELAMLCALMIGACAGFLWWNWPPAKIFMGDVASGFLGYQIAMMAIAAGQQGFSLWVWLILLGVFLVDATFTLLRRMLRGEKWYQAHRSHAYQHLTQYWGSHLRVTLAILVVNILWLAPLAFIRTDAVVAVVLLALLPLIILARYLGAGQDEPPLRLANALPDN